MISVIVPTLNEEQALPATLAALLAQEGEFEVIVSDGGSTDGTHPIARRASAVRLLRGRRGRALQMNAGARAARGEWLLFLHADTRLPDRALAQITTLPARVRAGCFRQAFDVAHPLLRAISRIHNWRCRRTRIMYGDQAMFVRRDLFQIVGGFPEVGKLEDVLLSERLRALTVPVMLEATVVTSARRFLAHGIARSFARILLILICHRFGLSLRGTRFFEPVR